VILDVVLQFARCRGYCPGEIRSLKMPSIHDFTAILVQKFSRRSLEVLLEDLRRERSELLHRRI
jgi:hypothetical protein